MQLAAGLVKELRARMAAVISDEKAYEVPSLCRRLGLANGSEGEAFRSKFKYAHSRLMELPAEDLVGMAEKLLLESPDFALGELVTKAREANQPQITQLTRRRIVKLFENEPLATEIEEIELIRGVWPITNMPSQYEGPYATLEHDIIQHTVANKDLTQRELLELLGLLHCSRAQLFRFLEAVTSPEAQTAQRQGELAAEIDALLRHDGYSLIASGKLSGSPVYKARAAPKGSPSDHAISQALAGFDPTLVHARWEAALERRSTDPEGAITLARTLLEDVCKWILDQAEEGWAEADDLPVLYRKLAKVLRLAPDDHAEQVFKQILGSCQSVVESLGALRNKLGDSHSPGPKRARPLARHAELAVNLSGAMATFLVETWKARRSEVAQ